MPGMDTPADFRAPEINAGELEPAPYKADPMPSLSDWCAPKSDRQLLNGPGRRMGSGRDVRLYLWAVATVVLCRMELDYLCLLGNTCSIGRAPRYEIEKLLWSMKLCSEKQLAQRVFLRAPHGSIGLVAKFDGTVLMDGKGRYKSADVEVCLRYNDVLSCACSCEEQCLRIKCMFSVPVFGSSHPVAVTCGISGRRLVHLLQSDIPPRLREGNARMCGDSLCVVRGAGGGFPWALDRI